MVFLVSHRWLIPRINGLTGAHRSCNLTFSSSLLLLFLMTLLSLTGVITVAAVVG